MGIKRKFYKNHFTFISCSLKKHNNFFHIINLITHIHLWFNLNKGLPQAIQLDSGLVLSYPPIDSRHCLNPLVFLLYDRAILENRRGCRSPSPSATNISRDFDCQTILLIKWLWCSTIWVNFDARSLASSTIGVDCGVSWPLWFLIAYCFLVIFLWVMLEAPQISAMDGLGR